MVLPFVTEEVEAPMSIRLPSHQPTSDSPCAHLHCPANRVRLPAAVISESTHWPPFSCSPSPRCHSSGSKCSDVLLSALSWNLPAVSLPLPSLWLSLSAAACLCHSLPSFFGSLYYVLVAVLQHRLIDFSLFLVSHISLLSLMFKFFLILLMPAPLSWLLCSLGTCPFSLILRLSEIFRFILDFPTPALK